MAARIHGEVGGAKPGRGPVHPPAGAFAADESEHVIGVSEHHLGFVEARESRLDLAGRRIVPQAEYGRKRPVVGVSVLQLVEELVDLVDLLTRVDQGVGEVRDQPPTCVAVRCKRERAPQEVLRGVQVAVLERPPSGLPEMPRRASRKPRRRRVVGVQLFPVLRGSLEVVPDELVLLD